MKFEHTRRARGPEGTLQDQIIEALGKLGFWCWSCTSGVATRRGYHFRMHPPGTPDIRVEPFGWLEVKDKSGKAEESQKAWHSKAQRHGVRVATVRSVREAIDVAMAWRAEG